jgi:mono/diheme cytochrome c family protein
MRSLRSAVIPVVVVCFAAGLLGQSVANRNSSASRLARGQYLVDHVSKCGDCHTPRDEKGQPITSKYLQGGDLGVQPVAPNPVFTRIVPDISAKGLTGWSVADLSKGFQTGKRPNGEMFRPPMPAYTMRREDADAIALYLKSLK